MRKQEFQTFLQVSSESNSLDFYPVARFLPNQFLIFSQFLSSCRSSISRFHAEGSCRVNCSSPRSSWLSAKTRNYFQKLILTLVHSHFCLCEVLARQKQVLKKFRPKIPIDFLLDPAKAVRWNGSGGGAVCSNENIISTMQCVLATIVQCVYENLLNTSRSIYLHTAVCPNAI